MYLSHFNEVSSGVAMLFSPDLQPEVLGVAEVMSGCLLHFQVYVEGLILNIYALIPGLEQVHFCWRTWATWHHSGSSGWPGNGRGWSGCEEGPCLAFLP